MNLSITSDQPARVATTALANAPAASGGLFRRLAGFLEDVALILLAILVIPLAILVIGTPIALAVRLLIELTGGL